MATALFAADCQVNTITTHAFSKIDSTRATLLICGGTWYSDNSKSHFISELVKIAEPFKDKVKFTGYIPYDKMPLVYAAADILVVPSMWDEPAGKILIEAMAAKVALVLTNSGGMTEYVVPDSCFIVERDERIEESLAGKIEILLRDSDMRQKFVNESFLHAQRFDQKSYYHQYKSALEMLLK